MRFHQLEFLGRQAAPLVQNRIGNRDLAHIVCDSPDADEPDLILGNALAERRVPQQAAGDIVQAADMLARLVAAELNGVESASTCPCSSSAICSACSSS